MVFSPQALFIKNTFEMKNILSGKTRKEGRKEGRKEKKERKRKRKRDREKNKTSNIYLRTGPNSCHHV